MYSQSYSGSKVLKLILEFGDRGPRRIANYWGELKDFSKYLKFNGDEYRVAWIGDQKIPGFDGHVLFQKIPVDDRERYLYMKDFDQQYGNSLQCECGALHTKNPNMHAFNCPLWRSGCK